jgi:hypothetical protein
MANVENSIGGTEDGKNLYPFFVPGLWNEVNIKYYLLEM